MLRLNRTRRYTTAQIGRATGVSTKTVRVILHRYGVKPFLSRPRAYSEEQEREVIRRYVFEGETCEKIAPDMHMHPNTVLAIVRAHGYKVRGHGSKAPHLTSEDCEPVRRMYERGLLLAEIAEQTGLPRGSVRRRLDVAGVPLRSRTESQLLSVAKGRNRPSGKLPDRTVELD